MRPDPAARPEYVAAFAEIAARIAASLTAVSKAALPIKMYVAGGAALHFYTGSRVSRDIDAAFSHRLVLPENLDVAYRDADGASRLLYFDRQYNDTFALMHEDARDDSLPLALANIDARTLDVRLLAPIDLAVSKVSRLAEHDRADIEALALRGLITPDKFRRRAEAAAIAYVGDLQRIKTSIDIAHRIVVDAARRKSTAKLPRSRAKKPRN
jgi:hypothetical protein